MRITTEDIARGNVLAGESSDGPSYDRIKPCRFCENPPSAYWHTGSGNVFVCPECAESVLLPLAADAANLTGPLGVGAFISRCVGRLTRACADRLYRSAPREALVLREPE
jgi:hypothetical protein